MYFRTRLASFPLLIFHCRVTQQASLDLMTTRKLNAVYPRTPALKIIKSVMQHRLRYNAMICRLGGCFFLDNFGSRNWSKSGNYSRKRFYVLYSAVCLIFYFLFNGWYLVRRAAVILKIAVYFRRCLLLWAHMLVIAKGILNFVSIASATTKLRLFFEASSKFETATAFYAGTGRISRRHRWSLVRQSFIAASLLSSYILCSRLFVVHIAEKLPLEWRVPGHISCHLSTAVFFVYDSLPYLILRECCIVLAEYIHAQFVEFQRKLNLRTSRWEAQSPCDVQRIRINLCDIRALKEMMNGVWDWALAAMSSCVLLKLCVDVFACLEVGVGSGDVVAGLSYSIYSSLCFIEIVIVSHALKDEVSFEPCR